MIKDLYLRLSKRTTINKVHSGIRFCCTQWQWKPMTVNKQPQTNDSQWKPMTVNTQLHTVAINKVHSGYHHAMSWQKKKKKNRRLFHSRDTYCHGSSPTTITSFSLSVYKIRHPLSGSCRRPSMLNSRSSSLSRSPYPFSLERSMALPTKLPCLWTFTHIT